MCAVVRVFGVCAYAERSIACQSVHMGIGVRTTHGSNPKLSIIDARRATSRRAFGVSAMITLPCRAGLGSTVPSWLPLRGGLGFSVPATTLPCRRGGLGFDAPASIGAGPRGVGASIVDALMPCGAGVPNITL